MPDDEAYERGFEVGRRAGFLEGERVGFLDGHRAGFFEGHRAGWEQGLRDAAGPRFVPPVHVATLPEFQRGSVLPPSRHAIGTPPAAPPSLRPVPGVSDRESDARRQARRVVQNANIALYAAALLIVAAAALFLASSTADSVRLAGLVAITGLFYAAGLAVHARVPRLRPAAVALTGTGLALLPVAGLAVDLILVHRPPVTWLATSLVGLLAFGAAAVRLESRLLVYLSLTFAFSAAWSGAAALGGALAADFAAILGLSAALGAALALKPRWIPPLILRPIARLHPYVAPATFVAATFAAGTLDRWQYPLLVAALAAYFGVASVVRGQVQLRRASWWAARTTAVIAIGTAVAQAVDAGVFGPHVAALDGGLVAASAAATAIVVAVGVAAKRLAAGLALSERAVLAEQGAAAGVQLGLLVALLAAQSLRGAPVAEPVVLAFAAAAASAQFVAWWHRRAGEFLPAAVFSALALVHGFVSPSQFAVLAVWGVAYWLARAASRGRAASAAAPGSGGPREGWSRAQLVAAARYASVVAVPAIVDALLPAWGDPAERLAAVAAAVAMTAAAQLGLTSAAAAVGSREFARDWLVSTMAAVAAAGGAVVCASEPRAESGLHLAVVMVVCAAAAAVSAALFPRDGRARVRAGELAPPLLLAFLSAGAFAADRWAAGNVSLAMLAALLVWGASRSGARARRWAYVWLARAAATALAVTLFHALVREGWVLTVAGQPVSVWHVLAAALLAQLAVPLAVGGRRSEPVPWAIEDAAAVLGAAALACAALWSAHAYAAPGGTGPGPLTATLVVGLGAGSVLSGALLRRRTPALALAPGGVLAAALLSGGDVRVLEVVVAISAAYSAMMVWLAPGISLRGAHLVAARALPLVLMALVVHDATASATAVSVALALGLAAQHALRRALAARTVGLPFQEAAYWSGLGAQLAVPVLYAATSSADAGGGRWVLLAEALLAFASVLATLRSHPRAGHVGVVAALLALIWAGPAVHFPAGQALAAPILSGAGLAIVLAALASVQAAGLSRWEGRREPGGPLLAGPSRLPWAWTSGGAVFAASAAVAGLREDPWVFGLGLGACAAVLIVASWAWRGAAGVAEATFPLGCVAALAAGMSVGRSVFAHEPFPWSEAMPALVGGVVPAGVAVGLRWAVAWVRDGAVLPGPLRDLALEPVRRWSIVAVAALALLLAARSAWEAPAAVVLPALAAGLVALAVAELPARARRLGAELGALLVVAALQRAVFAGHGAVSLFWLAQWHVALGAVVAAVRYSSGQRPPARAWLGAAAGLASLSGLAVALTADVPQQVWLLVAFAVLTAAGLMLGERAFTIWGAVGVLVCVLWAVRAYPYLLLAILGLALIGAAVWWLVRTPRGTLLP